MKTKGRLVKTTGARRSRPPISDLPADSCPTCGTRMREHKAKLSFSVNGEKIVVPKAAHLRCPHCGGIVLRVDDLRHLRESALSLYRKSYRLLSSDDIRSIRELLHLTQAALSKLLRLGGNTLSRWEAGRNVQTAAMDVLLRLIRDVPDSLHYLRNHAA